MKKFLIVLAMVVTASLLMGAGCFTVNTPPIITTLALPDATVGTAYTATVNATDADGDALTFSVSGPTGVVISGAGVISGWTPTESGTETVIVAVTDGTDLVSANFTITVAAAPAVTVAVTGVTLDEVTLALTVGDAAVTLVATVAPATATDTSVIWVSSDETVAIVALGVVTPLNAGISAITVTTVDGGFVATCVVTVTAEGEPTLVSTTPVIFDIQKSDGITSIVDLTSTKTQYINKTEAGTSILVTGIAGPKALVQVYIGSATTPVAVSAAATTGLFSVAVAETALGADSLVAKTLHATSTELALIESAASNVATFILDTDLPGIDSVAFTADSDAVAPSTADFDVTCSAFLAISDPDVTTGAVDVTLEAVIITTAAAVADDTITINEVIFTAVSTATAVADGEFNVGANDADNAEALVTCINDPTYGVPGVTASNIGAVITLVSSTTLITVTDAAITFTVADAVFGILAVELSGTEDPVQTFEEGFWVISFLRDPNEDDSILVASPSGVQEYHSVNISTGIAVRVDIMIPGIKLTFSNWDNQNDIELPPIGNITIEISDVVATTDAIVGRATLKFDEAITFAAATATTCVYGGTVATDPYAYKETNNTGYWTGLSITQAAPYTITVYGVKDLAGNVGGTSAVPLTKSAIAGAASATLLKP